MTTAAVLPSPATIDRHGGGGTGNPGPVGGAGRAGCGEVIARPSAALIVFWVVAAATLIFSHYQVSARLNLPYKALTVLVCLLMPLIPGFMSLLLRRQILYLLLFELVLIAGSVTGYTGSPEDLLSVSSKPIVMLRVLPFMLCGYTLAAFPRNERRFVGIVIGLFALFTLPDALLLLRGTASGQFRERFLVEAYDQASARAITSAMVNVSVTGLLLGLAGCRLYDSPLRLSRWLIAAPQAVLLSLSITAGFTAALILLVWCGLTSVLFAPARSLRFRLLLLFGLGITLPLGFYALRVVAGETGGSIAKIYRRVEGLGKIVTGQEEQDMTVTTSGRYALAERSLQSFARSPLVGMGKGEKTSETGGDTETHGGHSFLLDSLAQLGLLGTLPIILWLGSLAMISWRCLTQEKSWRASSGLSFVLTWIVAITVNPYFLGYLALNSVVFLWFGFILGDGARVAVATMNRSGSRLAIAPMNRAAG